MLKDSKNNTILTGKYLHTFVRMGQILLLNNIYFNKYINLKDYEITNNNY